MKSRKIRLFATSSLLFFSSFLFAQTSESGTNWFFYMLVTVGVLLVLGAVIALADNLMQVEAKKLGADTQKNNFGVFPKSNELFGAQAPISIDRERFHKLKKGYDIKLQGEAEKEIDTSVQVSRFAVRPENFNGISPIPKVVVEQGDEVLAGQELFFDKKRPEIKYVAPVSGEVVDIVRGAKRAIAEVVILADKEIKYKKNTAPGDDASREEIVQYLLDSGGWTMINQRPFDIIPDPSDIPTNVFISTFNTAPLAADANLQIEGKEAAFQKGIDILGKLTTGKVFLGLNGDDLGNSYTNVEGVERHWFSGPHPSGNVGVQIHHIAPISGGDKVWTLGVEEVATLGELFVSGNFDVSRVVAVTGAEFEKPVHVRTYMGANIGDLVKGNLKKGNNRLISGNVLTGRETAEDSFLDYRATQITALKEGDQPELFGWLLPLTPRPSISKTLPGFLMPNFKYEANTNTHGEKRAFVVTGQYESVLPMDIFPQHLIKAIMTGDFERMEGLGIRELTEEDIALCEFVCTSKMPIQSILREGLELVRSQS